MKVLDKSTVGSVSRTNQCCLGDMKDFSRYESPDGKNYIDKLSW